MPRFDFYRDRQALEMLRENFSELTEMRQIAAMSRADFTARYAASLNCDATLVGRIHDLASALAQQVAFIWANVQDATSPYLRNALFNNLPPDFLDHQANIPDYERFFGNLDYIEGDHARTIFGPAAYLVDLMRFIDANISPQTDALPPGLALADRRPDLLHIPLDKAHTYDSIPYLDVINDILEALVRPDNDTNLVELIANAEFPMTLPFTQPLEAIRLYLATLKTSLRDVYQTLGETSSYHLSREALDLSEPGFDLIARAQPDVSHLERRYGIAEAGLGELADLQRVEIFLQQTGVTRDELNELVYQNLDRYEVNAGLTRLFFINNVDDGLGPLYIDEQTAARTSVFDELPAETLVNLSPLKLDRIYRFVKLARQLGWSFTDLDWALRALQAPYEPEPALYFDGLNDYAQATVSAPLSNAFTIEAWVQPEGDQAHPILCRGHADPASEAEFHFLFWIDANGRLAFYTGAKRAQDVANGDETYGRSVDAVPNGVFSHVAMSIDNGAVTFYINGRAALIDGASAVQLGAPNAAHTQFYLGRTPGESFYWGVMKDVMVWSGARAEADIQANLYRRPRTQPQNLLAYWPMVPAFSGQLLDYSAHAQHGQMRVDGLATQPTWTPRDLVLDPLPGTQALAFNGIDAELSTPALHGIPAPFNALTMEAWIKVDEAGGNTIAALGDAVTLSVNANNQLVFAAGGQAWEHPDALLLDAWTHVAAVWAGNTLALHINMGTAAQRSATIALPQQTALYVGRQSSGAFFNGQIRNLRLWAAARSIDDLRAYGDGALPWTAMDATLIGAWPMNALPLRAIDGEDVIVAEDRSPHQNHLRAGGQRAAYTPTPQSMATLLGAAPETTSSAVLNLDGENDVIVISNQQNVGLGQYDAWTLELWFRAEAPDRGAAQLLLSQGDAEGGVSAYLAGGALTVAAWHADYGPSNIRQRLFTAAAIQAHTWHHLAITQDTSVANAPIAAYLNGAALNSSGDAGDLLMSPVGALYLSGLPRGEEGELTRITPNYVMQEPNQNILCFAGAIADFRLWQRALSEPAIAQQQRLAPDAAAEGLVAYLPLDEGVGESFQSIAKAATGCLPDAHSGKLVQHNLALSAGATRHHSYAIYEAGAAWDTYTFTGKLQFTQADSAVGVLVYAGDLNQGDLFYRLQRTADEPRFHLISNPQKEPALTGATVIDGLEALPGRWYRFRVEVRADADHTAIRARLWEDGGEEPTAFTVDAVDRTDRRLAAGTVGLWRSGAGEAHFDVLRVTRGDASLLDENFDAYADNQDPPGWIDYSTFIEHNVPLEVYSVRHVNANHVLATDAVVGNIHAHYTPSGVDVNAWTNYEYSGRLQLSDAAAGVGLTVCSQFPNEAAYYVLKREARADAPFVLAAHPVTSHPQRGTFGAVSLSPLVPSPNTWYRFRLRVIRTDEARDDATSPGRGRGKGGGASAPTITIQAKVWPDGTNEPTDFQMEARDQFQPLESGAVGVTTSGAGVKRFDDLAVAQLVGDGPATPLMAQDFQDQSIGQPPADWISTGANFSLAPAALFTVAAVPNAVYRSVDDPAYSNKVSHYNRAGALQWSDYTYTGELYAAPDGETGVTFYSRFPSEFRYYGLRRTKKQPAFHLFAYPDADRFARTPAIPVTPGVAYQFRIEARTIPSHYTSIRVKVWEAQTPEPAAYQLNVRDDAPDRLSSGTVGLWQHRGAANDVDNLRVWRETFLDDDFEVYFDGYDPPRWDDSAAVDDAFRVRPIDDGLALSARPTDALVSSVFRPAQGDAADLAQYRYQGRMRFTDEQSRIGVTFFNQDGANYALRRGAAGAFELVAQSDDTRGRSKITRVTENQVVTAEPDQWYRFSIDVEHDPTQSNDGVTHIRVKVWRDGDAEPADDQYVGIDNPFPLAFGGVGVQAGGAGDKYFDDLVLSRREHLLSQDFETSRPGQRPVEWEDRVSLRTVNIEPELYRTRAVPDVSPLWRIDDAYPVLKNAVVLQFDGHGQYLAAPQVSDGADAFTIEAWVRPGEQTQPQPIFSYGDSLRHHPEFWFGVNTQRQLTWVTDAGAATARSALATDRFSHVAAVYAGGRVTFYVNGAADGAADAPGLSLHGANVEIGRNMRADFFGGYLREARLWRVARSASDLQAWRHASPEQLASSANDLIAYWPFVGGNPMADNANGYDLLGGGAPNARFPVYTAEPLAVESGFWNPETLVMAVEALRDAIVSEAVAAPTVARRTLDVWFRAWDTSIGARKQVIYHEGDAHRGLVVYLHAGYLYAGGYNLPGWEGTWLRTPYVRSGQWHHVAVTLDGRRATRPAALRLYVDGQAVEMGAGAQLSRHPGAIALGRAAQAARFHDGVADGDHFLAGYIRRLRVWDTVVDAPLQLVAPHDAAPQPDALLLDWRAANRFGGLLAPGDLRELGAPPAYFLPEARLDEIALRDLGDMAQLMLRHNLSVDRVVALWRDIKHMGAADAPTLFDRLFNVDHDETWGPYIGPLYWRVDGAGNRAQDRAIRNRLSGALRLSDARLDALVGVLFGPQTTEIVINRDTLRQLYQLTSLPGLLRVDVEAYARLLQLTGMTAADSVGAVLRLSDYAAWLAQVGIRIADLDFLAYDLESDGANAGFTEASARAMAAELQQQSADFLANPESFVSDLIDQSDSLLLFSYLRDLGAIDALGIAQRDYAAAPDVATVLADAAFQQDLALLADATRLDWYAQVEAAFASTIAWTLDVRADLLGLGLTSDTVTQALQKLHGASLISDNARVANVTVTADAVNAALADTSVGDAVTLPDNVTGDDVASVLTSWQSRQTDFLDRLMPTLAADGGIVHNGVVAVHNYAIPSLQALLRTDAYQPSLTVLDGVLEALDARLAMQTQIASVLLGLRSGLETAVLNAIGALFDADANVAQAVMNAYHGDMPAARFLTLVLGIADDEPLPVELVEAPSGYLYRLGKALHLAQLFTLNPDEIALLLTAPQTFGVRDAMRPDLDGLANIDAFRDLRDAFADTEGQLIAYLQLDASDAVTLETLAALSGWEQSQIVSLIHHLQLSGADYRSLPGLKRLQPIFDLAATVGAHVEYLIDLADTRALTLDFYERHASALYDALRARFGDDQWYQPIRDRLALQWRDALLALAMLKIPPTFEGRRSADLLSEYFLLDLQTGSEVNTSRIQQAIASVQLYAQRVLMNLEARVTLSADARQQWEWMRNYRVWEANRKVFLYPENYIQPELRGDKTPLFEQLEQEILQDDITTSAVERVYKNYLDQFITLAQLRIVGAYRCLEMDQNNQVDVDTLYLVGRTINEPYRFYYRELHDGDHWQPWREITLSINSEYLTPAYGYGRLYLFWVEFTTESKSEDKRDDFGRVVKDSNGNVVRENVDYYIPSIRYSYRTANDGWAPPQTFSVGETIELDSSVYLQDIWQRVNVQQVKRLFDDTTDDTSAQINEVLEIQTGTTLVYQQPEVIRMRDITYSFWVRVNRQNEFHRSQPYDTTSPVRTTVFDYDIAPDRSLKATTHDLTSEVNEPNTINTALASASTRTADIVTSSTDKDGNTTYAIDEAQQTSALSYVDNLISTVNTFAASGAGQFIQSEVQQLQNALTQLRDAITNAAAGASGQSAIDTPALTVAGFSLPHVWQMQNYQVSFIMEEDADTANHVTATLDYDKWYHVSLALSLNGSAVNAFNFFSATQVNLNIGYTPTLYIHELEAAAPNQAGEPQPPSTRVASVPTSAPAQFGKGILFSGQYLSIGAPIRKDDAWNAFDFGLIVYVPRRSANITSSNPDTSTYSTTFLSEFRVWDEARSQADLASDLNKRITSANRRLFRVSLEEEPPDNALVTPAVINLESMTGLYFDVGQSIAPANVERLLIFHGDRVHSMRHNTNENSLSFNVKAWRGSSAYNAYDLGVTLDRLHVQDTSGLSMNDFSRSEESDLTLTYVPGFTLDLRRFTPRQLATLRDTLRFIYIAAPYYYATYYVNFVTAINQYLDALSDPFIQNNTLLTNLVPYEVASFDVNNQPGWHIVDTRQDQFLVRAVEANGTHPPLTLKSTEQRMDFTYGRRDNIDPQQIIVRFDNDPLLETSVQRGETQSPAFRYKFTRLGTFAAHDLSVRLFEGGVNALLSLQAQRSAEWDFDSYGPNANLVLPPDLSADTNSETINFDGPYGLYYWEVFFHIPFFIANQLNANQNFAEAQTWYHYILDPTQPDDGSGSNDRFWRFLPFRREDPEAYSLSRILKNTQAIRAYRNDPFDPHAIARLRVIAYQKAVVMKYIDNLLDWGDSLFTQDTRESINEALQLYILAFNLLGPRPIARRQRDLDPVADYAAIQSLHSLPSTPDAALQDLYAPGDLLDFITPETVTVDPAQALPYTHFNIQTTFAAPENDVFIGYWDRVEDRLFKIRHSLNIAGVFRQLALFEPPIDPAALVAALAGGAGIGGALAALNTSVPHYRYSTMLDRAKSMTQRVISLGDALLGAINNRDAERLTLLHNTHERAILDMTAAVKQLDIDEANQTLNALRQSLARAEWWRDAYQGLIDEGLSAREEAAVALKIIAYAFDVGANVLEWAGIGVTQIPDFYAGTAGLGPFLAIKKGGDSISKGIKFAIDASRGLSNLSNFTSSMLSIFAGYERREGEWKRSRTAAAFDVEEIKYQIAAAEYALQKAERELDIHTRTIEHNQEIAAFHRSKFGNEALYNWMIGRLSGLHFQAYKLAYDLAKAAERGLQYELPTNETYISFSHWDSLRKGLLAGHTLMLDLNRMEKSHLDQASRFLEINRAISLRDHLPGSLLQLIDSGICEFTLDEELFDRDFPGHYFRVIKTVSLTIQVATASGATINATLAQLSNKTLVEPSIDGVRYLLGDDSADRPDANVLRVNWRPNQQIAVTTPQQEDVGMFNLSFVADHRYFPFEGTGAVSTWRLEMLKASNPHIDFKQIEDVIVHLRYTSKSALGPFRDQVMSVLESLNAG